MEDRIQKAVTNHKKGYNCAQAVVCSYCDLFGIDEETAFKMAEGFGAGMGGLQETCGAVTAMFMLAGMKNSAGIEKKGMTKAQTYRLVKELADEFQKKNQTILCKELLGVDGAPKKRSCPGCIEDAASLVEQYLLQQKNSVE